MTVTTVLAVDRDVPDPSVIARAAEVLRGGGLVAFATETVYGLGADATREAAVRGIFAAKGRPADNPLIVHVSDIEMARQYAARWPVAAQRLASTVWPGPVTIVVPKSERVPAIVTAGLDTVGLRVPATEVARALIEALGVGLAAPSANRSEHVSPTSAEHVRADLEGRIDLILDSGPTSVGIESTVVDVCGSTPRVLRPGPLGAARLADLLEETVVEGAAVEEGARSPGQRARHYAPRVPALRVESIEELMALRPGPDDAIIAVGQPPGEPRSTGRWIELRDPEAAANQLYATLRDCDRPGTSRILVIMPPQRPQWRAIRDRLQRATLPADS